MSEIKRVATPIANTMTVLEPGEEIPRSPSSLTRRPLKKATSEGLISLSAEPGNVKFEVDTQKQLGSGGPRCSSAGRIERKLQLFKKKEDYAEPSLRRNSTDGMFYKGQTDNPLVKKINAMTINTVSISKTTFSQEKPTEKPESESSESEGDSDESESDETEKETSVPEDKDKVTAPLEIKAEFIECVMNAEYEKAQIICQKILLLEPDNATCKEFHSVIVQKIEQENMEESDEDSEDEDEEEEDEDDVDVEEEEEENSNSSSSSEESDTDSDEEEFIVSPGLNLLMGGLPIKPQTK